MRSVLKWISTLLAFVMVCGLVLVVTFEWWAKGIIARQASAALGRTVIIAGDLDVKWSRIPSITVEHIRLANTDWGSQPDMGRIRRLALRIDLRALRQGRVVIPSVEVLEPALLLESSETGIPNWLFTVSRREPSPPTEQATAAPTLPTIGQVAIRDGRFTYHDHSTDTKITGIMTNLTTTTTDPDQTIDIKGVGQFEERPFNLSGRAGALPTLQAEAPYPLQAQVRLGEWRVTLEGTLVHPFQLAGVDLDVTVEGIPAETSTTVSDARPPSEPLYRLKGHLMRQGATWVLDALTGSIGNSDLAGRVAVSMPGIRPLIEADLTSRTLDLNTLVASLADRHRRTEPDQTDPSSEPSDPLIDLQVTRAINGRLTFRSPTVKVRHQTLQDVTANVQLQDGHLILKPRFAFAGGTIDATVGVEDREGPLSSTLRTTIQHVKVVQILPTGAKASAVGGILNGTADLAVSGRTVSELITSIHGKASLTMLDQPHDTDFAVAFSTFEGQGKHTGRQVNLTGEGRVRGQALRLQGRAGSLSALYEGKNPYPVQADFQLGDTQARLDGTVSEPWQFTGFSANVAFKGPDPALLSPLLPFALPHLPPYQFEGHLHREGHTWAMQDFKGAVGKTDLAGTLVFDTSDARLFLRGDLHAQRVQVDELTAAMSPPQEQATPTRRASATADERRVIPDIGIDPDLLRLLDAEVRFQGKRFLGIKLPVSEMSTALQMRQGEVKLSSTMSLGGGSLHAEIEVASRMNAMKSNMQATFEQVELSEVLRKLTNKPAAFGNVQGHLALSGTGASLGTLLSSAHGDVSLTMVGGHLDSLLMELVGLDIGEAMVTALMAPKDQTLIRCLLADFMVSEGIMRTQLLLFDTSDTKIVGEGSIDVGKEVLNLRLDPRAKDFSLFSAEAPLYLTGSFSDMSAKPKLGEVLLSLAVPIKLGQKEDSDCQGLRDIVQKQMPPSKP